MRRTVLIVFFALSLVLFGASAARALSTGGTAPYLAAARGLRIEGAAPLLNAGSRAPDLPIETAAPPGTAAPTATAEPTATPAPTVTPAPTATPAPPPLSARFEAQPGDRVTWVRPGVVHLRRTTDDPLRINLLLFDLTDPAFALTVRVGQGWLSGRQRTSTLANEGQALAAVNGDLFSADDGVPQGLTMTQGQVLTAPKYRATFAWSPQAGPFIGYFTHEWTWLAEVEAPDGSRAPLTLLNTRCPPEQICLFNAFARAVPGRKGEVRVILGRTGQVEQIVRGERVALEAGQQALAGNGAGASWLLEHAKVGAPMTVRTVTDPPLTPYTEAISGGPIILRDGAFVQDCLCALRDCRETREPQARRICEDFSTYWKLHHYLDVRMPRTALGFDREATTLIVAVIDGYQRGYSRGITQRELADLLREFGAHTAMELDGGGSSTMVLEGEVMNRPPDETGERYVANALLFYWRDDE